MEVGSGLALVDAVTRMAHLTGPDPKVYDRAESLARAVLADRERLDERAADAADNWRLDRIAAVERNILRIGIYELLTGEVPPKVAIDEAVQLAHWFGGAKAPGVRERRAGSGRSLARAPVNILIVNWQDRENPMAGGAEIHLHEIFGRLASRGHRVRLICSGWKGGASQAVVDGIEVRRFGDRTSFALKESIKPTCERSPVCSRDRRNIRDDQCHHSRIQRRRHALRRHRKHSAPDSRAGGNHRLRRLQHRCDRRASRRATADASSASDAKKTAVFPPTETQPCEPPEATGFFFSIKTMNCSRTPWRNSPRRRKGLTRASHTATSCSEAASKPAFMASHGRRASHRFPPRQISGGRPSQPPAALCSGVRWSTRWASSTRRSGRLRTASFGCAAG